MQKFLFAGTILVILCVLNGHARADAPATSASGRELLSLDPGWRFQLGDIPMPVLHQGQSYPNAKAGKAWGAAAPEYNDSNWRVLNLPHDWAVERPFDRSANGDQGFRPRGIAWYRRQFTLPESDRGRFLELEFGAVATYCTVWFNGTIVHRNFCGYTGFNIDITPFAEYGNHVNTIAIRVDADAMEGWWYEGAGIYRHTYLAKRDPLHVITDGIYANPVKSADGGWTIPVEATLENSGDADANAQVQVTVLDPSGNPVASGGAEVSVPSLEQSVAKVSIPVATPHLWSLDDPALYTVRTVVKKDGVAVDSVDARCGCRTIRFDADKGFFLNDQPVKIKGACNHQDAAGVGTAIPDAIIDFRLRRLKEMGSNACRCSHNPPTQEFLDACDRMGMLVMDENRNFNVSPEYKDQLEWMVRRDRNHPSVILWSVFNEEPMQATEQGCEMVRRMSRWVKDLDNTRPITAAMSGGEFERFNVSQVVDVVGFNYNQYDYDRFHQLHPDKPMTSSEDTSAVMTRGIFVTDKSKNLLDSYDDQHPGWGETHHDAWYAIASRPFIAGGFCWTGFDYRGEPTPFSWPSISSSFGCMDTCGFPKTAYYINQADWIDDRPILNLVPHWNWAGQEGKPIKVLAMTNADSVALSLNGTLISKQPADKFHMVWWQVPYAAGTLEAVAYRGEWQVARTRVQTTGAPAAVKLIPDRQSLRGDGQDAMPITVEAVDDQGRDVPTAGNVIDFQITGATIIGLGDGDPNCHEPEKGTRHSIFNGLGQVTIQSIPGSTGVITLKASSDGLQDGSTTIQITPAAPPEAVPAVTAVERSGQH